MIITPSLILSYTHNIQEFPLPHILTFSQPYTPYHHSHTPSCLSHTRPLIPAYHASTTSPHSHTFHFISENEMKIRVRRLQRTLRQSGSSVLIGISDAKMQTSVPMSHATTTTTTATTLTPTPTATANLSSTPGLTHTPSPHPTPPPGNGKGKESLPPFIIMGPPGT